MAKDKSKQRSQQHVSNTESKSAGNSFQRQLQELLKQKKYARALEEIKKNQRWQPDIEFTPTESEIWMLRGEQEFHKQDFKQAEKSFRRVIELSPVEEAFYWQAKCLLELNQVDAALNLLRNAFEQGNLTKEYSICYLKLLLLKGETDIVEELINKQPKRFSTAQLYWVQGVISLKNQQFQAALASFQKIKRPITPRDIPTAWIIYTQQAMENWDAAAKILGLHSPQQSRFTYGKAKDSEYPILQRLATFQQAQTGLPPLTLETVQSGDKLTQQAMTVMLVLQLIEAGNHHDAAHAMMEIQHSTQFPELKSLRPSLLTLAGQQALTQGETECAEVFWQALLAEQPFNPQLAVNLLEVLEVNDSELERQQLLTRLLKWLELEGKKNPQEWPSTRLKPTLAHLHCRIADAFMAQNRDRAARGALQQAERIDPTSREVMGRKGLVAAMEENYEEAIALLTQAIEGGCRYEEVYNGLLNCWEELQDKQGRNEARRRYGKYFGDLSVDSETEVIPWVEALSTLSYPFYSRLVQGKDHKDPALRACQMFVNAVQSSPNSGGRVSLNQQAVAIEWAKLLQTLSASEQISVLQAITLSIHLFAKRDKGIAALINQYVRHLFELSAESTEARIAHLVVLAVKENTPQKLDHPLRAYLDTMPQPGNALANIQLQARRFGWIKTLIPTLDEALRREPQNPLLLLARATTYPVSHSEYEQLKQQGFELARRLQDAKALQAFREEQAFLSEREAQENMPDPEKFDNLDLSDMDSLMEEMIRKFFGSKMSKAELERMLPELKKMMFNNMPDFVEEDDDELDLDFMFDEFPPTSKKRKGRRGGFQELF
ncbi:MAG: tetratricopeptide repeat protein [Rhizonema sp. PD38]|nr:tetratricopeptide repeat protein [Rhizonema sp. PD38]